MSRARDTNTSNFFGPPATHFDEPAIRARPTQPCRAGRYRDARTKAATRAETLVNLTAWLLSPLVGERQGARGRISPTGRLPPHGALRSRIRRRQRFASRNVERSNNRYRLRRLTPKARAARALLPRSRCNVRITWAFCRAASESLSVRVAGRDTCGVDTAVLGAKPPVAERRAADRRGGPCCCRRESWPDRRR